LVGAPAGYVGFDQGGSLTEQVRRRPYSVVLFDEVEKAHPDVFHILLQILEDGVLTDNTGNSVSFEHTLIIMTSNIGMESFDKVAQIGFDLGEGDTEVVQSKKQEELERHIMDEIQDFFRPELLGRMSGIIFYQPLSKVVVRKLFQKRLSDLKRKLKEKGIALRTSPALLNWLVKEYLPESGARSVDKVFLQQVEPKVIEELVKTPEEKSWLLDIHSDAITVNPAPSSATVEVAE
jgi:ATP-dependent Clp protease ATP-binding subunit ClpC